MTVSCWTTQRGRTFVRLKCRGGDVKRELPPGYLSDVETDAGVARDIGYDLRQQLPVEVGLPYGLRDAIAGAIAVHCWERGWNV